MSNLTVRPAEDSERRSIVNTLTLSFSGDPFNRWYLPDGDRFLEFFPQIADALLTPALEAGTCYVTENLEGVAMWFPPGAAPDEAKVGALFEQAPPPQLLEELGTLLAKFEEYHPHDDDCWYLPLIGVDPGHQGKGLGGALMKHACSIIDEQGALSYLESSSARNIPLYERYGFEVITQLPFGEQGDNATPMIRSRRA